MTFSCWAKTSCTSPSVDSTTRCTVSYAWKNSVSALAVSFCAVFLFVAELAGVSFLCSLRMRLCDKGSATTHNKDMITLSNTPMIFATASVRHASSTASYASHALATTTYCDPMSFTIASACGNASFI